MADCGSVGVDSGSTDADVLGVGGSSMGAGVDSTDLVCGISGVNSGAEVGICGSPMGGVISSAGIGCVSLSGIME